MKKVALLQSNYIPWKGYFSIIANVDLFVFHDDLQYTKQDWRNRNKIKTDKGLEWLTIPCGSNEHINICDVQLNDKGWQKKHWNKIYQHYRKAKYFKDYQVFFEEIYLGTQWDKLSDMNQLLIKRISTELLGLNAQFDDTRKYNLKATKSDRVIELLRKVEATDYYSGSAAKSYLDVVKCQQHNINVHWMDYSNYKVYPQLYNGFEHAVSIIDLVFNVGPDARKYL
ncbi:WbqC family protein [Carboxylicivirga sediminis]|uniref:WbqC family protein n=1 Tax=Carboxylicivirga sediminis TaxID=2006564 RepID=A0A941F6S6_9BACT|nr:WbqC family protein [Carboxylicivirga sediminis]MBR8537482.1 WbqC family protein [Carboxylicivirga sediminis]